MNRIWKTILLGTSASVFAWAGLTQAEEPSLWRDFQIKNRLRLEYDDNIYQVRDDKHGSGKIEEEVEFIYNLNLEQVYLGLHYRPAFVYWEDRPSDDWDLHHDFDIDLSLNLTPRLTFAVKDSFLYAQEPELMDRGIIVQQEGNYIYNRANADLAILIQPQTRLELGGRQTLLRYENDNISELSDYDIYAAGASLRTRVLPDTSVSLEGRAESISYSGPDRDALSEFIGVGLEQRIGADLIGSVRGGYQHKDFSAEELDAQDQPYVDASLTVLSRSHRTRLTGGAGYSMFESDVYPYANQERTLVYVSASHDLTARLAFFLTGSYQHGAYNGDQSVDHSLANLDGDEDIYQASARAAYRIGRNHWLEANYQYLDIVSDVREDFDRNRVSIGWRATL